MIRADLCATRVKMAINGNGKQKLREKVLLFNRADKKKSRIQYLGRNFHVYTRHELKLS